MRKTQSHELPALRQRVPFLLIGLLLTSFLIASPATAQTGLLTSSAEPGSYRLPPGVLLAQADGDDAYDPFADYSEFEESIEEEEDINFFRNGRLFTMGFVGGFRGWTGNLQKIYSGSPAFGLFLSYFFDLRFAMQFSLLMSDHTLIVKGTGFDTIQGTVSISDLQILMKYYFNTQNVTRGLADLNPYLVGGFSQVYRTVTISGTDTSTNFAKDQAFGFNIGAGIEIPMMRNKMYFGAQGMYQLVAFSDESLYMYDKNDVNTGVTPAGDSFSVVGILGINF